MTAIIASIAAVWTASAASMTGTAASAASGDIDEALVHNGSSAGTSIRPAPCALAIRKNQSACHSPHEMSITPCKPREHERIDDKPQHHHHGQDQGDRGRVAERDWKKREQHDLLALSVQAERNGKQPAHGGIDAVIEPEPGQHDPGPQEGRGAGHRSRIAVRIGEAVAALEPDLVRKPAFGPFDKELRIKRHAAVRAGVELHHPAVETALVKLRIDRAIERVGEIDAPADAAALPHL